MAQYFFHMQTDLHGSDPEAIDLPDHAAARRQAIRTCGEMMRDAGESFWNSRPWTVTVTDGDEVVLWHITMSGMNGPGSH